MRGKKSRWLRLHTLLLIASLTLIASLAKTARASPETTIYLDPSVNTFEPDGHVGYLFNVTVWVGSAPDVGGVQIRMEFNDTVLNVTRWFEPKNDPQYIFYGETATPLPTPPDAGYIHLALGEAYVLTTVLLFPPPPDQPPGSGTKKVCIFELNITMSPPPGKTLTSSLHINTTDTYMLDPDGNEVPGVIKLDGTYNFVPEFPVALAMISIFMTLTTAVAAISRKLRRRI